MPIKYFQSIGPRFKKNTTRTLHQSVIDVEKERVQVLKTIASGQTEKNSILRALTTALSKIADK